MIAISQSQLRRPEMNGKAFKKKPKKQEKVWAEAYKPKPKMYVNPLE